MCFVYLLYTLMIPLFRRVLNKQTFPAYAQNDLVSMLIKNVYFWCWFPCKHPLRLLGKNPESPRIESEGFREGGDNDKHWLVSFVDRTFSFGSRVLVSFWLNYSNNQDELEWTNFAGIYTKRANCAFFHHSVCLYQYRLIDTMLSYTIPSPVQSTPCFDRIPL